MALHFINNTGTSKKTGEFTYDTIDYEYTLYLMPLIDTNNVLKDEIINYFGNRSVKISETDSEGNKIYKESLCLGLTSEFFVESIENNYISAFVKINPKGVDNIASATIQIYDHCEENPDKENLQYAQVWINDVCRVSNIPGNQGNPVKGLFYFIEQLTIQNLGKDTVKLFVETKPIENLNALRPKYESLGFNRTKNDEKCEKKMKKKNGFKWHNIIMSKTNIISEPDIVDLSLQPEIQEEPFVLKSILGKRKRETSIGGKKTKKQKIKLRSRKIKNKNNKKNKVFTRVIRKK